MRRLLLAAILLAPAAQASARAGGGSGGGGGCFPAGTEIATMTGAVPIEKVKQGDKVLAFSNDRLVQVKVNAFIEKKDRLLKIRTNKGNLTATPEHPLLTRFDFTEARNLRKGDFVAVLEDGRRAWAKITSIKPGGTAKVYNLEVDPPHTFIADGFIVHNKGGSFSSGYSGGSSYGGYYGSRRRSRGVLDLIFLAIVGIFLAGKQLLSGLFSGGRASYRAVTPRSALLDTRQSGSKAARTLEILKALGRRDPAFNPVELEHFSRRVFVKVQAAWQERDYSQLRDVMMPSLLSGHAAKVDALKVRGEINMMADVQVLGADFVHVRCPREPEGRSFTVLITASARDYTINERTNFVRSGSMEAQTFQEYWTFHQLRGNWALARIDQVGEMDYLNAPNLPDSPNAAAGVPMAAGAAAGAIPYLGPDAPAAEPVSDHSAYMPPGMRGQAQPPGPHAPPGPAAQPRPFPDLSMEAPVYPPDVRPASPEPASRAGAPPPPLKPAAALPPAGARQVPEVPDAHWSRQKMEIAAPLAFESVYEAWSGGDSSRLSADYVSAEALAKLRRIMDERKAEGLSFEYKNLFARRAEVVLTSPAAKSKLMLDEFTARINATAVRAMLRNGKTLHRDEAPAPFTEYWVFGRQDKAWKLRDILPRMDQESEDCGKDGAPGPAQIEWYWHS
jgi:predicted lipid-binding transport protein (Tim44 family)